MVQLMKNGKKTETHADKMAAVKNEVEDPLEDEHAPFQKRLKVIFRFYCLFFFLGFL